MSSVEISADPWEIREIPAGDPTRYRGALTRCRKILRGEDESVSDPVQSKHQSPASRDSTTSMPPRSPSGRFIPAGSPLGKFAFGDRTIPIHARTLGPQRGDPNAMGVYYVYGTVRYSLQCCTLTRPPLVRTHTSNPAFPTGGGLGGFVSFVVAVVNVVATSLGGVVPLSPCGEGW